MLIDRHYEVIASGTYEWENQLIGGYWTYDLKEMLQGVQAAYEQVKLEVQERYGVTLQKSAPSAARP